MIASCPAVSLTVLHTGTLAEVLLGKGFALLQLEDDPLSLAMGLDALRETLALAEATGNKAQVRSALQPLRMHEHINTDLCPHAMLTSQAMLQSHSPLNTTALCVALTSAPTPTVCHQVDFVTMLIESKGQLPHPTGGGCADESPCDSTFDDVAARIAKAAVAKAGDNGDSCMPMLGPPLTTTTHTHTHTHTQTTTTTTFTTTTTTTTTTTKSLDTPLTYDLYFTRACRARF
jgi:hypothetical protein